MEHENNHRFAKTVIFNFSFSKKSKQVDSKLFDHSNIISVKLYLKSDIYPYERLNKNWANNSATAICYFDYSKFKSSYYGEKRDEPLINVRKFKENYPMHMIDCSR